ncbi:S-layer homology domain-containing protein [Patescibacteria group bacterium]|nr:S-layer homology domain-containing protein [Patescibacteria group bacterium]
MSKKGKVKEEKVLNKPLAWLVMILFFMGAMYVVNLNATFLQTSLLPQKVHAPFDGTVSPVKQAPDWVSLSGDQWNYNYEQMGSKMIDAPKYDPARLAMPVSILEWGNAEHNKIRNEKITYPVAYMGNYELDGMEGVGSHLAVDIKLPIGTPVYAIANGIVTKVSLQSSGFGKHVVIKHENFPTLNDSSATETLHSSYSHLNDVVIPEGAIVTKGTQIGTVGNTGTATTPHLHFQIDNDLAPWHPYWAFTYQEAVDAGYSFFEAINSGLGKERALDTTINPMKYVQKYADFKPAAAEEVSEDTVEDIVEDITEDVSEDVSEDMAEPASYKFDHDGGFEVGVPEKVKFVVSGDYPFGFDELIVMSAFSGNAEFGQKLFSGMNYSNGGFEFHVIPLSSETLRVQATLGGEVLLISNPIYAKSFTDVSVSHTNYSAIKYLQREGIIAGYPDGTFKPDQTVSRVEALKMILSGIQKDLVKTGNLPFPDVVTDAWYTDYVSTAYVSGIVGGYPDNTFKPGNAVNKAEFFKILLLAMEVDMNPKLTESPYTDVPTDAWFAPYVGFVKDKNLLNTVADLFSPEDGMTRGDVAEAMFRVMILSKTSADTFSASLVDGIVL